MMLAHPSQPEKADTLQTMQLGEVSVVATIKENGQMRQQPASVSLIDKEQMVANHVTSLKGTSNLVPNLFIPDYGSRLTSAVYIRGIGSRINNPAVGLYVDNIPYVDKSAFDFNFLDTERIDVLRGPQGTLYGTNTMGGVVRVYSKNPFHYEGTDAHIGYATGNNQRTVSLTHHHRLSDKFALSASGYYEGADGFFHNDFLNQDADETQAGGGRLRGIYKPTARLSFDLTLGYDYTDESAYPYFYTGVLGGQEDHEDLIGKITNNRQSSYRRGMFNSGLNIEYKADTWQMNAVTGYQNINDRMFMDQDFIAPDIYTLEQRQKINTLTEEVTLKNINGSKWEWLTGAIAMYQSLHTTGPVHFYDDGLRWLEGNINSHMPDVAQIPSLSKMGFTSMSMNFRGDDLMMGGVFDTPKFNTAVFHQSTLHLTPQLSATVGLRLEYEKMHMDYNAPTTVNYGFTMANPKAAMMQVDLQDLSAEIDKYNGKISEDYLKLLPKFALKYEFDAHNNVYASVSKGQRSGGYNVQMFSDLLQGAMQNAMMQGIQEGVENYMQKFVNMGMPASVIGSVTNTMKENMPVGEDPTVGQVVYKPEHSWNYEMGTHLTLANHTLAIDAALFYNRIYNQQIARFAPSGFGRMMVNAGKSQSCGGEMSVRWTPTEQLAVIANYGYTHAKFLDYDDGQGNDYSDCYVPYVPMHNMNVDASYTWSLNNNTNQWWGISAITIGANCSGAGRIYWTESNNKSQSFYTQCGARVALTTPHFALTLWGKNLNDSSASTFFFESAGRGFEQHCRPLQVGVDITMKF